MRSNSTSHSARFLIYQHGKRPHPHLNPRGHEKPRIKRLTWVFYVKCTTREWIPVRSQKHTKTGGYFVLGLRTTRNFYHISFFLIPVFGSFSPETSSTVPICRLRRSTSLYKNLPRVLSSSSIISTSYYTSMAKKMLVKNIAWN